MRAVCTRVGSNSMRALCNEHSPAIQFYKVKQMQAAGVALRAQQYTVTVRQVC
jgi:hypothetical protein